MQLVRKLSLYEQLEALHEGLTGEIINGQLHTQPRPTGRHVRATVRLDRTIGRRYDDGDDGPGGWWILVEPEVHFVRDAEVCVPDLAGWRRERMPDLPDDHRFEVVPDWICEVISSATASKDREVKLPLYAEYGVAYAWLVDPKAHTLEAYALEQGTWRRIAEGSGEAVLSVAPFEAMPLELSTLWT